MSRSFRKTPITGMTLSDSEKVFKVNEHQRERTRVKQTLVTFLDDTVLPAPKQFGNPWAGPKDGKTYWKFPGWRRK